MTPIVVIICLLSLCLLWTGRSNSAFHRRIDAEMAERERVWVMKQELDAIEKWLGEDR